MVLKRLKDPPTWLKVTTTLEKTTTPTHSSDATIFIFVITINVRWSSIIRNEDNYSFFYNLKSAAAVLFNQQFVKDHMKENTKDSRYWPLQGESNGDRWTPLIKASDAENFPCQGIIMICSGTQRARLMRPTWGPPGSCRPQMGPMLAPWTRVSMDLSYNCSH